MGASYMYYIVVSWVAMRKILYDIEAEMKRNTRHVLENNMDTPPFPKKINIMR
jgi:hypothetical protein